MSTRSAARSRRTSFTLLELVVVIMILATLAGLVIPQVSMLGRSSDMAATSKNTQDVANNLGLFFVLQKRFPQGMDSLLADTSSPADGVPDSVYVPMQSDGVTPATNEANQARGLPISGPDLWDDLTLGTLTNVTGTAEFARSFTRCGFDFVFDHSFTAINSNSSATLQRALGTPIPVAELISLSPTAVRLIPARLDTSTSPATTIPAGTIDSNRFRVVALGFGQNATGGGKTALNAPIYPGCDGRYYGRYIAFFKVYATGERATLLGVTDSYGRTSDYSIQQFNESLPDDSRQG